ncbi:Mad3/BUB1 homology region 1-domain-containing protein [Cytidiella melzeri]|nr:Mad3/BUB1 homology region 1-domain-containing protein [Cytidiella melzeri]
MAEDPRPDIVEQNVPPIVDCDVLEAAKENIQPLAKGRRVTALSAILATPHAQRENQLAATRQRLRTNVDVALGDSSGEHDQEDLDADPLEAYCTYVYWVVENYPQGHSAESGLLELLEEATRVLKDHQNGKWRTDLRYLKLWVLYASYVEKPIMIYKFCIVNEIGVDHGILYEEAALALERAGRKSEADQTYLLGIARKARPLERLEAKHREFQKRMMASPNLPNAATSSVPEPITTPAVGSRSRRVLGDAAAASSSSTLTTRSSIRVASSTSSSTSIATPVPSKPQPNSRIQVFVDGQDSTASSHVNNEDEAPSEWPDLGTRKSRVKENVREATKAAGTTLRQSGRSQRVASSSSTPKISVFRDPVPNEGDENQHAEEEAAEMPPPPLPAKISKASNNPKSISIFQDDSPEKSETKSSKSGKGILILQDEDPEPSQKKSSKAGKGLAVFRDEDPESSTRPEKTKAAKSIAVFRDEQAEPGPLFKKYSAPPKVKTSSKSAIPVFCDDETVRTLEPKKTAASGKAKGIDVFRDEDEQPSSAITPGFTPFKDESECQTQSTTTTGKGKTVGLGISGLGGGAAAAKMSSEAEALRKDPLKNYPDSDKTADLA